MHPDLPAAYGTPESPGPELLSTDEMYRADAFAVEQGIAGRTLMETAGTALANAICDRWSPRASVILCGPGNNGGDGFVAARLLAERGWPVTLYLLGERDALKGDAALAAADWQGDVLPLAETAMEGAALVVDALFGAGLTRPLDGTPAALAERSHDADAVIVSVDVPSGVDGNTGAVLGTAFAADLTVTFHRAKPGHYLLPGRTACGELAVADIGIPDRSIEVVNPSAFHNSPELWGDAYPRLEDAGHKYGRGHALVVSGPATKTGAARLAARGALRGGAGLVTVASPEDALAENAAHLTAIMLAEFDGAPGLTAILEDRRKNAALIGPGAGVSSFTRARTLAVLRSGAAVVLDADALTAFEADQKILFDAITAPTVLTPHDGEFARLFPDLAEIDGGKPARARAAATRSKAVMVLKGADTVIAAPDGRIAINDNAPPTLATAGAGDVLGGFILAQLAQGVPAFEAACIGVWLHGEAATRFGPGLIAEDLPDMLPEVLEELEAYLP